VVLDRKLIEGEIMNKGKLAVICGVIATMGFSFTAQAWAADADTKKQREAVRNEVKQDRKEIVQDRKEIRQDHKELTHDKGQLQRDRRALQQALARKAPASEITSLRARLKAGEAEVAGDRKELRADQMERKRDVQDLNRDQKAVKSVK
jgi:hypothetical protein